ncbi:DUF7210 family protein [Desulforhopalus singaporensis]|uniref:DUF7210 domain-containing protein n=1 Tax=Desulforhopalus singaporensis TaxID=91360 RepID=A0A1H0VEQ8_9BACT|nr:hypothetical protein [Desulforhopalus singaporensis]SDP77059.1 hypothetical protein SAMN05660330_04032 [Desulforhopalus singaporensis]
MKAILTKPVKIKGEWHKAGSEMTISKEEYKRLCSKDACVVPITAEPEEDSEEKE